MPRLFSGLELPPDIVDELALLRGGMFGARWLDPDLYHLTLRFFGDVDHGVASDIDDELARIRRPAFRVTLETLGVFGGDRPRDLVMLARAEPALVSLQADHERAARRAGLAAETRRFTPHVTLARLRGVSPDQMAQYLSDRGRTPPMTFLVDSFALLSSRDLTGGGPYVVEATYPLEGARALASTR